MKWTDFFSMNRPLRVAYFILIIILGSVIGIKMTIDYRKPTVPKEIAAQAAKLAKFRAEIDLANDTAAPQDTLTLKKKKQRKIHHNKATQATSPPRDIDEVPSYE